MKKKKIDRISKNNKIKIKINPINKTQRSLKIKKKKIYKKKNKLNKKKKYKIQTKNQRNNTFQNNMHT